MAEDAITIKLSENNNTPGSLVRPSSLNYKISLSEAVGDFIKKDMPHGEDQFIDVNLEDPKIRREAFLKDISQEGAQSCRPGSYRPQRRCDLAGQ